MWWPPARRRAGGACATRECGSRTGTRSRSAPPSWGFSRPRSPRPWPPWAKEHARIADGCCVNGLAHAAAPPIAGPVLDNKRVAAALIDLLVLVVVGFLLATLSGAYTTSARLVTVAWVLYYYFALELLTGQTLGKKLMGLRVAQADGRPPELRQVAVRTVLRLVDGIGVYLVGLIAMLATGDRRQRLGDLAAGTIVTTADEPAAREPHVESDA